MNSSGSFKGQPAPCGQLSDSEHYEDHDDDFVTRGVEFACGCTSLHREYQDGSVSGRIVHHDGRIMVDELLCAE